MTEPRRSVEGARSWLFVPADRAGELLAKASASDADVLVIDLEDALAPTAKERGRASARDAVARISPPQPIVLRINGLRTSWWRDDVEVAVAIGVDAVMIPKVGGGDELVRVAAALRDATSRSSGPVRPTALVPLVETAAGVLNVDTIAACDEVAVVAFGGEDFASDVGMTRTRDAQELRHAQEHVVLAAAAAGRLAIDTPVVDPRDIALLAAESERARAMGFGGKLAIHPRQVAPINAAFSPSVSEVAAARVLLGAFDAAVADGRGVAVVEGRMVDEAVAAAARRIVGRSTERPQ